MSPVDLELKGCGSGSVSLPPWPRVIRALTERHGRIKLTHCPVEEIALHSGEFWAHRFPFVSSGDPTGSAPHLPEPRIDATAEAKECPSRLRNCDLLRDSEGRGLCCQLAPSVSRPPFGVRPPTPPTNVSANHTYVELSDAA